MLMVEEFLKSHSRTVLSAEPVASLEPRTEREVTEPLWPQIVSPLLSSLPCQLRCSPVNLSPTRLPPSWVIRTVLSCEAVIRLRTKHINTSLAWQPLEDNIPSPLSLEDNIRDGCLVSVLQIPQNVPALEVQQSHRPVAAPGRHDPGVEVELGESAGSLDPNSPVHRGPASAHPAHRAVR